MAKEPGSAKLPTVQAELSDAVQVCCYGLFSKIFFLNSFKSKVGPTVGFEELYSSCYRLIPSEVSNVITLVESKLMSLTISTPAQAKALESAFYTLANKKSVERMQNDIKIFIEACIARNDVRGSSVVMLVTNDNAFFEVFAQSKIAEDILLEQVEATMKAARHCNEDRIGANVVGSPVRVKLAGEIIPGM